MAQITMPRWFGPVVTTILRSPAHSVVSKSLLHGLVIIASEPETKNWWRNLSAQRPVRALAHYLQRFAFVADRLGVTRAGDAFDQASLRATARQIVMVRLTPLTEARA